MSDKLTKYKEGSVRELWTIAYPMILAFLSGNLMMFADRLFLANYSMAAMNAAAAAGMAIVVFQYGAATITSIAEVFVGQFNGAKEYRRTAAPVWQMLWFSAAMLLLFGALATWGGPYLLADYHYADQGLPYYQWLLYFAVATPMMAALSGFFVGIGKTRCVMVIAIAGNMVNIALDYLLIFGVDGWIPAMGAKGAAIATGVSQVIQVATLFVLFIGKKHRDKYGTTVWRLEPSLLLRCLRVGVPNAIGHMLEWTAWATTLRMMAMAGEHYLTVAAIGQSMYMLVAFGFEGVQKAVTTVAANRIGANKEEGVWSVWRSAVKLLLLFGIPFGALLLGWPDPIIAEFLSTESPPSDIVLLVPMLRITALGVFIYYLVDGFTWICVGVLTAAEDTVYVMWVNGVTAWLCGMLPIWVLMVKLHWSPALYFLIISFYGTCNALIFYRRMSSSKWLNKTDALA
ncbi:Uncharacterized protein SCG7086_AQ_00060 [Chlamydiales bacterium SCGC AG-110-P3]|nr:Uncharacterized protein SCG7086_AQ_00060 [Chlamydiales bacterium SCGC AG-110-P3]